jgi:hypothetical protein
MMCWHSSCNRSQDVAVDPSLAYSASKYMRASYGYINEVGVLLPRHKDIPTCTQLAIRAWHLDNASVLSSKIGPCPRRSSRWQWPSAQMLPLCHRCREIAYVQLSVVKYSQDVIHS